MSNKMRNPKGTRDLLPEKKLMKNKIIDLLKNVFEKYGFEPLETPSIQRYEVLSSKYAGGSEILEETYSFEDRGERKLGLRYDLTIPLCRVVASNKQIPKPFKRYEIGRAWRDGPVKKGRLREFWQCDVDTVGSESMLSDAEFLKMMGEVLEELGLDFTIKFNNRKILDGILKSIGVSEVIWNSFLQSVDKLEKIGEDGVREELMNKGFEKETIDETFEIILSEDNEDKLLDRLRKIDNQYMDEGLEELVKLERYAKLLGIDEDNIEWNIALSRGLDYYTNTVYEAFLEDSEVTSAVAAGGRYNDIIGKFTKNEERVPAVGLSFGIDAILEALEPEEFTSTKALVVPIGEKEEAIKITEELRKMGINTDIDLMDRGISKNLDYANSKGIPYTILIGENEVEENKVTLKDMKSGDQEMISVEEVEDIVK